MKGETENEKQQDTTIDKLEDSGMNQMMFTLLEYILS